MGRRYNVGLLTLADRMFQKLYAPQIASMKCYANYHGYDHFLFDQNDFPDCDKYRGDFFYQKHCLVSRFLELQPANYVAVIFDADVVAVVLNRGLGEWLDGGVDLQFYTRGTEI